MNGKLKPGYEHVWTPRDVEQETLAGYFRQWQGDNAKLNAWWKENREAARKHREWMKAWEAEHRLNFGDGQL